MASWFPLELDLDVYIVASKKGFTTNELALEWLKHYIKHLDARPNLEWKILLMDNYRSHETREFIMLANEHYILPYPLLAYMTYCIQPLDVSVFQPYKH